MPDTPDNDAIRDRLLTLRAPLDAGAGARRDMSRTVELDQTRTGRLSRMEALQAQAMARAEQQRANLRLRQIDAALQRLTAGTYGDCAACGEPIALARLEADPATPFCRECAGQRQG